MEVTFLSKVRSCQCEQEGQMFHSFAQPEGFELEKGKSFVSVDKGLGLKLGITGGPGERLFMPILKQ